MLLDNLYSFDWKVQKLGEKPNFFKLKLSKEQENSFFFNTTRILHNIFYRGTNSGMVLNHQLDKEIPGKPDSGYYLNLTGGIENSIYFFDTHGTASYCFDKEIFKLFWSKYAYGRDDNFTKEAVMYDIMNKMSGRKVDKVNWDTIQVSKSSMDEIQAILWLSILGSFYGSYLNLQDGSMDSTVRSKNEFYSGFGDIFQRIDGNLTLFLNSDKYNLKSQIRTYLNPDYLLFDGFMKNFLQSYKIDEGLWGLLLQMMFEYKKPHDILLNLWCEALDRGWMENEQNYGFFYMLWKYTGGLDESKFAQLFSGKKSLRYLYEELRNREERLIINFSSSESVFAFMAFEFFFNLFYIVWWHYELLSNATHRGVDTKDQFTMILGDWMNIIYRYTKEGNWNKFGEKKPVFTNKSMPHYTFFSNLTPRKMILNDGSDEDFAKKYNQVWNVAVTKIRNGQNQDLNPIDGFPLMVTLYSKRKFELNALTEGYNETTKSYADKMIANKEEVEIDIMNKIQSTEIILKEGKSLDLAASPYIKQQVLEEGKQVDFEKNIEANVDDKVSQKTIEMMQEEVFSNLFSAEDLYEELRKKIFGQDAILKHMSQKIYTYLVLKKENDKPLTLFLVGPPGTGKTYLSEVLVQVLNKFISDDKRKFNAQSEMATNYQDSVTISKLLGASASYAGHGDKISFFEELLKKKNQIILFDEIEKGDPSLYPFFLDFMNNGKFESNDGQYGVFMGNKDEISYLPKGEKVQHLSNVILIFASNAITSDKQVCDLSGDSKFKPITDFKKFDESFINQNRTLRTALGAWRGNKNVAMDKAFLDRLQLIYLFNPLDQKNLKDIVLSKFDKIIKTYNLNAEEARMINLKFKLGFMKSSAISDMKDAHSMRELQAIIDDWIARSLTDLRTKKSKTINKNMKSSKIKKEFKK